MKIFDNSTCHVLSIYMSPGTFPRAAPGLTPLVLMPAARRGADTWELRIRLPCRVVGMTRDSVYLEVAESVSSESHILPVSFQPFKRFSVIFISVRGICMPHIVPADLKGEATAPPVCGIPCPASLCHLKLPPSPPQAVPSFCLSPGLLQALSPPLNLWMNQLQAFLLISCSISAPYGFCSFNIFSLHHHPASPVPPASVMPWFSHSLSPFFPLTPASALGSFLPHSEVPPPGFLCILFCCLTISCPYLFPRNF